MYCCHLSGTFSAVQKIIFMRCFSTEMNSYLQTFYNKEVTGGQNDSI